MVATYTEVLPTGRLQLEGSVSIGKRLMHLDLRESAGGGECFFCLFPPTPPVSILGGLMCGETFIGPDAQPSVTRIAIVRLPVVSAHLQEVEAYLPSGGSICHDLATLGLPIPNPAAVDQRLSEFLTGDGNGLDQVPLAKYRALVDLFDRAWLTHTANAAA